MREASKEKAMTEARKIIVYIATSADGYIARRDGNVDWLNRPRTAGDYGMGAFYKSIDTILWGRTTYDEAVARFGGKAGAISDPKSKITNFIFTHRPSTPLPGVKFVNEPIRAFAKRLRAQPGKDIWIMGGAGIIGSFLDAGEIDEFIIHVIPIFIGDGIRLIEPRERNVALNLLTPKNYSDGVVRLHYSVPRQRKSRPTPAKQISKKRQTN
jgi:dihydrofolate reductase